MKFAVLAGGHPGHLLKDAIERIQVRITGANRNILDFQICYQQHAFRFPNADFMNIINKILSGFLFEISGEISARNIQRFGDGIQRQILVVMLLLLIHNVDLTFQNR